MGAGRSGATRARLGRALAVLLVAGCAGGRPPAEEPDDFATIFESLLARYDGLLGSKAIAFAYDGEAWAVGYAHGRLSDRDAEGGALARCREEAERSRVAVPCRLYARNDEVVWTLDAALEHYAGYPKHKAMWVVELGGDVLFGGVMGHATAEAAALAAIHACEEEMGPSGLAGHCRLCLVDDGLPCIPSGAGLR